MILYVSLSNYESKMVNVNIGTGKATSVLQFLKSFEKVNNVKIPFVFGKRRLGDTAFLVADNSLIKSLLNWVPKKNLDDICRDGWNWQLNYPNGY